LFHRSVKIFFAQLKFMDYSAVANQFTQTKLAAQAGNIAALNKLKISYFNGESPGIEIDSAVSHLRDESRKGDPDAQYTLGQFYYYAIGVRQDSDQAVNFWQKAAERGLPEAQNSMGQACSSLNIGGRMNHSEAVSWFVKAADQGHVEAISNLAGHLWAGKGIKMDKAEGVKLWKRAADSGDAHAATMVGRCYANGDGVDKDAAEAIMWFEKAKLHGDSSADEKIKNVKKGKDPHGGGSGCLAVMLVPASAASFGWFLYHIII
jgi:TPR repeat protein